MMGSMTQDDPTAVRTAPPQGAASSEVTEAPEATGPSTDDAGTADAVAPDAVAPDDAGVHTDAPSAQRLTVWPVVVLTLCALAAYVVLSLARWHRWDTPSWDNAIFEQGIRGWAGPGWPIVDIKGHEFNQLGDHFSPVIALLAPFYRLFPGPQTLLVAQCVLVAISIVPVTVLARRRLGAVWGLLLGIAYAGSWGVQSAIDVQFHEYAFAAPILALGLKAALEKRWTPACMWIATLLLVKEDMGLTVAGFGVVLWIWGERRRARWMVAAGLGGMALVLGVIIPLFNPNHQYDYWGRLAEDGTETALSLGSLLAGAGRLVANFLVPEQKISTLVLIVVVTAFTALRSPLLLMIVPTMVWRFAGSTEYYWGPTWHYSLILMPIVFVAAIDGTAMLRESRTATLRTFGRWAPALMAAVGVVLLPSFPLADLGRAATYERAPHVRSGEAALAVIPAGTSVTTDLGLIVHLTRDHRVYWVGTEGNPATDYVAIRVDAGWGPDGPTDASVYAEQLYPGHTYTLVFDDGGFQVARRDG